MSDEEEEAFSASEDEWKPSKERGGESSDDDDSEFEEVAAAANSSGGGGAGGAASRKRESEQKSRNATKAKTSTVAKKRKSTAQSLRTKLYNKYRPPPKTFPSPTNSGGGGSNSPSASTSRTASKNAKTPNESNETRNGGDGADNDSSSDCSVDDYLVDPAELDLQSSFFNVEGGVGGNKERSGASQQPPPPPSPPPPVFDCNAGLGNLSDSDSEDNNDSSAEERTNTKAFDFRNLLEKANSLERVKEAIAMRAVEANTDMITATAGKVDNKTTSSAAADINSLLALGEKPKPNNHVKTKDNKRRNDEDDDDDDDDDDDHDDAKKRAAPQRLNKTKSTRVKRHTKTRPTSTVVVATGDTDDSEFEEVADEHSTHTATDASAIEQQENDQSLEIHVELPTRQQRTKQTKTQQELELAFKRKLNCDMKKHQLLLHKTTLLCCLARNYTYNRLLNDAALMQAVLKLLPSTNAYPPERGTEIKYFQSFVSWYGGAVRLARQELFPPKKGVTKKHVRQDLLEQVQRKEAQSKQDFVMIFIALVRAMGLQCRLVVNMQPLALRPAQADLVKIKLNPEPPAQQTTKEPTTTKAATATKTTEKAAQGGTTAKKEIAVKAPAKVKKPADTDPPKPSISRSRQAVAHEEELQKKAESAEGKPKLSRLRDAKPSVSQQEQTKPAATRNKPQPQEDKPKLSRLKRANALDGADAAVEAKIPKIKKLIVKIAEVVKPTIEVGSPKIPDAVAAAAREVSNTRPSRSTATASANESNKSNQMPKAAAAVKRQPIKAVTLAVPDATPAEPSTAAAAAAAATGTKPPRTGATSRTRNTRSRSKSPAVHVSTAFLQTTAYKKKFGVDDGESNARSKAPSCKRTKSKSPVNNIKPTQPNRVLRQRQKTNEATSAAPHAKVPQLDGTDDAVVGGGAAAKSRSKRPQLRKLQKSDAEYSPSSGSGDDFESSPPKRPKKAPTFPAQVATKDRRVLSTDEEDGGNTSPGKKSKENAADIWAEVWCDVEDRWVCVDLFRGKLDAVDSIRRSASTSLAYVFAYQNDSSLKDVTARYCPHWTTTVRKARVEKAWLDAAIGPYLSRRTARDRREDQQLRRIHEEKPLPTTISDFKDHPLYALERHLLKFQGIYPPDAATLGFIRGEPIYSRDCVHLLHSRDIWLKQARTVKLGEQPYKVVKARPKWDRVNQTVIKDQPLEIFGYWQTQQYEPPTAENGLVPRNAYGNVELFKECMLPKKTVHLKLPGLNRICKKLGIDCANAVIGFDFHQGSCHPMYDGFVVCEEFQDQVTAAWYQDQEDQERKEQEKRDQRIWGNWKKLIRGLLIRERLKKKYNF